MEHIDIQDITADSLEAGDWREQLPELYALEEVREQNAWHRLKASIFDHIVAVYRELEIMLPFDEVLLADFKAFFRSVLKDQVGDKSREDLLKIMVLVHDIHKKEALIINPDGSTKAPGHELFSARLPQVVAGRFGLDAVQVDWLRRLTLFHDLPHNVLEILVHGEGSDSSNYLGLMQEVVGEKLPELMLFVLADMRGSDLRELIPEEYATRETKWVELVEHMVE